MRCFRVSRATIARFWQKLGATAAVAAGLWLQPGSARSQEVLPPPTPPALGVQILPPTPAGSLPLTQPGADGTLKPASATDAAPKTGTGSPSANPGSSGQNVTPGNSQGAGAAASMDRKAVEQIVTDYLTAQEKKKKEEDEKKKKEEDEKGYEVGSDLNMTGLWDNGLIFLTPNKDWRIHVGGRFQYENVFWAQPDYLRGPAPGNGGLPAAARRDGVGTLLDGSFFRRVRLRGDGVGYELVEFVLEVDFEQLNFITYDHLWVGFKDLPWLGTVRVGQHKVPQGMEMMGSDYHLTFLERSSLSDAFWTLFAQGVFIANDYFNQNVTFQTMFHRIQPTQFYNEAFGNGTYAETSRLTWTPYYDNEGANLVHIGGSYQWRHATNGGQSFQPGGTGNAFADTQNVVRFRARPELRDATGIGSVGNGLLGGNPARFVDTGFLLASNVHTLSPEYLLIWGPFSVQAEGAWVWTENVRSIYPLTGTGTAARANLIPRGTTMFWGGYVEASYFLTGEHRGYDRRFGVYDRPKVRENFFLVRGDDGHLHYGFGAWQVAYRYSYLDLDSHGVNGGQLLQHTFGLNWYFNDNTKIQFQYSNVNRLAPIPANSGTVHGFGMLLQWYF